MFSTRNYAFVGLFLFSLQLHADQLPRVTGLNLTGNQLTWDAQEGAVGYNIHLDYQYYDTVRGGESYTVSLPGRYHVISFNDQGDFGVTRNPDETGQDFDLFSVLYEGENDSVNYNFSYPVLLVYNTCKDVGPGESCIARCPNTYEDVYEYGSTSYYKQFLSGGACSTSDIVEADAFVGPATYSCTVPTFSGEVVAQAVCVMAY